MRIYASVYVCRHGRNVRVCEGLCGCTHIRVHVPFFSVHFICVHSHVRVCEQLCGCTRIYSIYTHVLLMCC